jgi:hypothetical protein
MKHLLDTCRENFGPPPRSLTFWERCRLWSPPPAWLSHSPRDELWSIYRTRNPLLRDGQVVWGALVQANSLLFSRGRGDCPAAAVYSPDPFFDAEPGVLHRIGHWLFELKGTAPADPTLRKLADDITDERKRSMKVQVPESLTNDREVYYTCIMVQRRHLPQGYLADGLFPLIVNPAATQATMILPARYWSRELIDRWRSERREPTPSRTGSSGR